MIIEQPAIFLRWIYPHALWRMDRHRKAVYLTFDDGPIPAATPFILDTLERFGARATFFMVGDNAQKYPHLVREVRSRGHRIGNHTFHHLGGLRWKYEEYLQDVYLAGELLHTDLFRPPHGWMRVSQYHRLRKEGFKVVMWDVVTRDYSCYLSADDVVQNVKRYTRPGSIITFHDSLKSIDKLKGALPRALQWLCEQGYEFCVFE
ncbi:MAG: polysaccharide deacetylase family protein [Bacteroidaceae bacterium]|nr:polysaccharide deacetylase family protein [Bacteroidaceae bacterium]